MDELAAQKALLRKRCRQTRDSLGAEFRARASLALCQTVAAWDVFQKSATVLVYLPMKSEASLTPLFRLAEKRWVLPRILENRGMAFHPYEQGRLILHPFGMAEPAPDLPLIPAEEIELALVPGLAFDRRGGRLGYGGGYYDRFLAAFSGISAGIVFHDLLLEEIPRDAHDALMDWIVTEREIFRAAA